MSTLAPPAPTLDAAFAPGSLRDAAIRSGLKLAVGWMIFIGIAQLVLGAVMYFGTASMAEAEVRNEMRRQRVKLDAEQFASVVAEVAAEMRPGAFLVAGAGVVFLLCAGLHRFNPVLFSSLALAVYVGLIAMDFAVDPAYALKGWLLKGIAIYCFYKSIIFSLTAKRVAAKKSASTVAGPVF